jgi:hypothetical protein
VDTEQATPPCSQQNNEHFLTALKELAEIKQEVVGARAWFKQHARPRMIFFRVVGVLVIALSVSVPFIAAQTAPWKDMVVSLAALTIALLTGLNSFFRWEHAWQSYRQTQYALDHLLALWELRIVEAKHQANTQKAIEMAIRATEQLLLDARAITSAETSEYFKQVQMPQGQVGK